MRSPLSDPSVLNLPQQKDAALLCRVEQGIEQQVQLLALPKSSQIDRLRVDAVIKKAAFQFRSPLAGRFAMPRRFA